MPGPATETPQRGATRKVRGLLAPGDETPDDEHLYVDWVRLTPNEHTGVWETGVQTYGD